MCRKQMRDGFPLVPRRRTRPVLRMPMTRKAGFVDRNCQIHGIDGLAVSGSSVFPTAGAANPTLMIVAMTLRLADHLKSVFMA